VLVVASVQETGDPAVLQPGRTKPLGSCGPQAGSAGGQRRAFRGGEVDGRRRRRRRSDPSVSSRRDWLLRSSAWPDTSPML
jgi:hypothetical protein